MNWSGVLKSKLMPLIGVTVSTATALVTDPAQFCGYLANRIGSLPADSSVRHGLEYRQLKAHCNAGDYTEALAAYERLRQSIRRVYHVDLDQPHGSVGRDFGVERPNLILMDIQLPGMDGLEATALLKQDEATRAIPVIALTALAMKGDEERIRAAGCDGYIAKPMRYQDFLIAVSAQLAQP